MATSNSRCRSCGAPIIWARTTTGKLMPLDAQPNPAGNVTVDDDTSTVHATGQLGLDDDERWMPHFVTCPSADQWRNR
jgi:hypothetical protein